MTLFDQGSPQEIMDVLNDKDQRVAMQRKVLATHPEQTLVVIKLNVPGPVKNNVELRRLFVAGVAQLEAELSEYRVLADWNKAAGNTVFLLVPAESASVKNLAVGFEDANPLGRLFDVDVLSSQHGGAMSRTELGLSVRKCFLCDRPAKECARSRRHSVGELQAFIESQYLATIGA